jgi:nucleotide-binding universal stress UspA family protein
MMTVVADRETAWLAARKSIFSRVLVGIDGSDASLEAAVQAARLLEPTGDLTLFGAYNSEPTLVGGLGWAAPVYLDEDADRESTATNVDAVRRQLPPGVSIESRTARGPAWHELLQEADRAHDSLIAVGSHGRGRMLGTVLGSTATAVIHRAPCSLLVARTATPLFPSAIVVGVDGSLQSLAAADVAVTLASRLGARVHAIAATGDDPVDVDGLVALRRRFETTASDGFGFAPPREAASMLRWSTRPPIEALLEASARADLLVVGSRGLRRLAALGSVSERLAHKAPCSVLIVRDTDAGHDQLELTTADADDDTGR